MYINKYMYICIHIYSGPCFRAAGPTPQTWLSMPTPAGVVVEKGSQYILARTGPKELDWCPHGGCGSG